MTVLSELATNRQIVVNFWQNKLAVGFVRICPMRFPNIGELIRYNSGSYEYFLVPTSGTHECVMAKWIK